MTPRGGASRERAGHAGRLRCAHAAEQMPAGTHSRITRAALAADGRTTVRRGIAASASVPDGVAGACTFAYRRATPRGELDRGRARRRETAVRSPTSSSAPALRRSTSPKRARRPTRPRASACCTTVRRAEGQADRPDAVLPPDVDAAEGRRADRACAAGLQESATNPTLRKCSADPREPGKRPRAVGLDARQPDVFSNFMSAMVRVGELTGRLEEVFLRLYHTSSFEEKIREAVKAALRYPIFVLRRDALRDRRHQHLRDPGVRQGLSPASRPSCR